MLYKASDSAWGKKYVEFAKTEKLEVGVYVLPKILDEEVARLHLDHCQAELSKLSSVQAEYLGLTIEGPFKSDHLPLLISLYSFPRILQLDSYV